MARKKEEGNVADHVRKQMDKGRAAIIKKSAKAHKG